MIGNTLNGIEDPDKLELSNKISVHITNMPSELRDRFKALKTLQDQCDVIEDERESEIHELEVQFEALYADLYRQREEVINGTEDLNKDMIEEFN